MKPMNIISAYNSSNLEIEKTELTKEFKLSEHESRTLAKFIDVKVNNKMYFYGIFKMYNLGTSFA